jgi:hypothetical protein
MRLLLLFLCLAACSTTQVYPGPKLPAEQVSRIDGTETFYGLGGSTVLLKTIDGVEGLDDGAVKDWDYAGDLELLPGDHTISASYELNIMNTIRYSVAPCTITFRAEPGHSYAVNGTSFPSGEVWSCWIEDTQTAERTEGTFQRAGDDRLWPVPSAPQQSPPR